MEEEELLAETPAPARDGVAGRGGKVEAGETGEVPEGEARDLRLAEEGWEAKAETAVAGVTGAESWLLEEKEVSLRASERSSVCAVAAEILRDRRSAAVATAVAA